ncbi:hypothetical protein HDV00_002023 [Rhizophlyctis rosea]|nr:hypothetical protein HDV00_002023 [Rhizophlyctis rosea]
MPCQTCSINLYPVSQHCTGTPVTTVPFPCLTGKNTTETCFPFTLNNVNMSLIAGWNPLNTSSVGQTFVTVFQGPNCRQGPAVGGTDWSGTNATCTGLQTGIQPGDYVLYPGNVTGSDGNCALAHMHSGAVRGGAGQQPSIALGLVAVALLSKWFM